MVLPNTWGQGQLFAFSALDGPSYYSDDFCGMLLGDHIGVRFFSRVRRELLMVNVAAKGLEFEAVTGDYISLRVPEQGRVRILYARAHLIIGEVCGEILPAAFTEGKHLTLNIEGGELHDTQDGDVSGLKIEGNRFAYAFGHRSEDVLTLLEQGLSMNPDAEAEVRTAFYARHGKDESFPYARLYAKCLSVMRTQLYSPEADFTTLWSTPDRLPHRSLWLWDSVFHALGHRHIDMHLAENLVRAVFVHQAEDGFIPHMANVDRVSEITQPPIIAWGAWQLYSSSHNRDFLKECYDHNRRFLDWCRQNRRLGDLELYTWKTTGKAHCRCDECGMDNSPRFDTADPLYAIDFSCFMANEVRHMGRIAEELHLDEEAESYREWYGRIAADINARLWSEEDKFYFDRNAATGNLHKVWSIASFLPLFAGVCDKRQASYLVCQIQNPDTFATPFPIPSISMRDVTFGSDMWRGPVWINYNYLIFCGLADFGYDNLAKTLTDRMISIVNDWYERTGTIYELYDSLNVRTPNRLNRKGPPFEPYNIDVRMQSIRDYGWSCCLICDLLAR